MTAERTVNADADPRWSCARKKAYPDMAMAKRVAARVREKASGARVVAYACTNCGRFHIGRGSGAR